MYNIKTANASIELRAIEAGIFRVRISANDEFPESLLSKYNILRESGECECATFDGNTLSLGAFSLAVDGESVVLNGTKAPVKFTYDGFEGASYKNKGFTLNISLDDSERIFGLGDESRDHIARRLIQFR